MGNWGGSPCISHLKKYTIGWELDGEKSSILGKSMSTNFPRSPHTMGFVAFSRIVGNLWGNPYNSIQWTVNMENMNMNMEVSNKSVFPTSFGRGRLQGNLFSFENESDLQIIYLTSLISKTSFYRWLLPDCSRMVKYQLYIFTVNLINFSLTFI